MKGISEFCTAEDVSAVLSLSRRRRSRKPRYLSLGSISSGTLRPEDVIPEIIWSLDHIRLARADRATLRRLSREWKSLSEDSPDFGETAIEIWAELDTLAGEYAPPACYFGAHPGDGADFGVWYSDEIAAVEFSGAESPTERADKLETACRRAYGPDGVCLEVSDHGNVLAVWERSFTGDPKIDRWRRIPDSCYR